jgi:hypothetical protein
MTEVPGRDAHPDIDQLADFDAGLDVADDVRAHVATCADCRQALDALAATRADISALPPVQMPDDVAARVDDALAKHAVPQGNSTIVPIEHARSRRRRSSLIAGGVAASVLALLVAGIVWSSLRSNNKSDNHNLNAAAGRTLTTVVQSTGRDYTDKNLNAEVTTLLRTPPVSFGQGLGATGSGGTSGQGSTSGSGSVAGAAPQPKASADRVPTVHAQEGAVPPGLTALQTNPAAVNQCIQTLLGPSPSANVAPLAIDIARFDGKPAAIFVFPKQNDPAHLAVYVVPADGCTSGIFQFHNVPR